MGGTPLHEVKKRCIRLSSMGRLLEREGNSILRELRKLRDKRVREIRNIRQRSEHPESHKRDKGKRLRAIQLPGEEKEGKRS